MLLLPEILTTTPRGSGHKNQKVIFFQTGVGLGRDGGRLPCKRGAVEMLLSSLRDVNWRFWSHQR